MSVTAVFVTVEVVVIVLVVVVVNELGVIVFTGVEVDVPRKGKGLIVSVKVLVWTLPMKDCPLMV